MRGTCVGGGTTREGRVVIELATIGELDACLERSKTGPVFLFKHSTACPISASARRRVEAFEGRAGGCPPVYVVHVIEHRSVSDAVAERLSVRHQSPQLMLVREGIAVWAASHHGIYQERLEETLVASSEGA